MSFRSILQRVLALCGVLVLATSCAGSAQVAPPSAPLVYKLGVGDKVRITVFGEQSLNGEYPVGPDGTVSLPLVGNVAARGNSTSDLRDAIITKLSPEYILDPRVAVDVVNFRPFYILGEVARPGAYPYVDGLSVLQAVAIAGGYSYRANQGKVHIRRADEAVEQRFTLKSGAQVWVMPGDTIRISERFF